MYKYIKKLLAPVIIIILIVLIRNTLLSIHNHLKNEQTSMALTVNLEEAKRQNQFLKERLYFVKTDEFVEREAREKLNMVRNGEHIVIAPPLTKTTKTITGEDEAENWQRWMRLFF